MSGAEAKDDNSFFMKLTIKSLSSRFPNVKNASTHLVHQWMYGQDQGEVKESGGDGASAPAAKEDGPGRVVILVRCSCGGLVNKIYGFCF